MHKMENLFPCLLWDSHFFLSGCDYFADKHLVEELKKTTRRTRSKDKSVRKQQTTLINATKRSPKSLAALNANNGYSTTQNWTHHKRTILLLTTAISD